MKVFVPFTKSDDELRMVWGYASTEALDSQGEVVAKTAIEEALPDYMKFANIREMHTTSAVGKAHEAIVDEKGLWLGVKVVDDTAWVKVKEGVYNGFSIGGKIITKINDTITKLRLTEISLVDRPANPEAVFAFYKGDGMEEENQVPKTDPVVQENVTTETETAKSEEGGEVNKADEALAILKGYVGEEVWDAQIALTALDNIMYLLRNESYEEEDMPEQIKALQDAVKAIKAFIVSEIQEDNGSGETATGAIADENVIVELSDKVGDIAKAGAAISAANKAKLSQIMALCKEVMGEDEEGAEKGDGVTDLAKGEEIAKAYDMLKSELDLAKGEIAKRDERIAELEALPAVPKGAVNGFAKSADYGQGKEEEAVIVKNGDGSVNDIASMIKAIHGGQVR